MAEVMLIELLSSLFPTPITGVRTFKVVFEDRAKLEEALNEAYRWAYGATRAYVVEKERRHHRTDYGVRYETSDGKVREDQRLKVYGYGRGRYYVLTAGLPQLDNPDIILMLYIITKHAREGAA